MTDNICFKNHFNALFGPSLCFNTFYFYVNTHARFQTIEIVYLQGKLKRVGNILK